jgi:hypothetical protein
MFGLASFSDSDALLHCEPSTLNPARRNGLDLGVFQHSKRLSEVIMKSKLIAALLVATSASLAAPAFASGYGPAPFYRPEVGAPASQRGPSAQTLAAEQNDAVAVGRSDVGGSAVGTVESASQRSVGTGAQTGINNIYRGQR